MCDPTDGSWRALDARELFGHQRAAGQLYKAALRAELTRRLGLTWTPVDEKGIAEIVGVPGDLAAFWSKRREQVERDGKQRIAQREAELGRTLSASERAEAFQLAAYATRTAKTTGEESTESLRARWRDEATALGPPVADWLGAVLPSVPDARRALAREISANRRPLEELGAAAREALELAHATFSRAQVSEAASRVAHGGDAEAMHVEIERIVDAVCASRSVVRLPSPLPGAVPAALRRRDGTSVIEPHGAPRYATVAALRREALVLEAAATGAGRGHGVVAEAIVEKTIARFRLGEEQAEAVRSLLGDGDQLALFSGPAGAGKSRALGATAEVWAAAGYRVTGLAPSAMAAGVLAEEAGIRTDTLAAFLLALEREDDPIRLGPRDVLVLDEASMARTVDLAPLVAAARNADAKLVLAGDPHQLGAVGAGGLFATLVADYGGAELSSTKRFAAAWERAASLELRAKSPGILLAYEHHGRIEGGSREELLERAFAHWRVARDEGASVAVMTPDNATATELALRFREDRVRRGEVAEYGVPLSVGLAGLGDEVVTLRNDRTLRSEFASFVRNGERWIVTGTGGDGSLTVSSVEGRGSVNLPAKYVAEHVALGYALTIHKAQGQTVDCGIVLVTEAMGGEALYAGMTRGRLSNHALVAVEPEPDDEHARAPKEPPTPVEVLGAVLRRSGVEASAHQTLREELTRYENRELLRNLIDEARRSIDTAAGPDHSAELAKLERNADAASATERAARAASTLREIEEQLATAKRRLVALERPPLATRLPGSRGEAARDDYQRELADAIRDRDRAFRALPLARSEHDRTRDELFVAEENRERLLDLRVNEAARRCWLREHPDEARWVEQLERRLAQCERETRRPSAHSALPVTSQQPAPGAQLEIEPPEVVRAGPRGPSLAP